MCAISHYTMQHVPMVSGEAVALNHNYMYA